MEEKQLAPPAKKQFHFGPIFLLLAIAAVVFWMRRPVMPKEFPGLKDYSSTLVASHQEAVVDAQLTGSTARYILDLLAKNRFKRLGDWSDGPLAGDLTLRLGDSTLLLGRDDKKTYALVTSGGATGYYQLQKNVYTQITGLIYESFPGGVQTLDPQPWWQQYLAFAVEELLENDFNSPKEIPVTVVVDYTFAQMVADGSAEQFSSQENGQRVNNIPYSLFLQRARRYFTEGAGTSLKQSNYYNAATACFTFPAQHADWYGNYPYTDYTDPQQNYGYKLSSVTRDQNGNIHATFEDYNQLGFQEQGTLTQYHHLTLGRTSEGDYRFLSMHSELSNPSAVSAEGYFTGFGTLAGFTADQVYTKSLSDGMDFNGNFLLHSVQYSKDNAIMTLYLVDSDYGSKIEEKEISSPDGKTIFREILVVDNSLVVKTNREILLLDENLEVVERSSLPTDGSFDTSGYDICRDLNQLAYIDGTGVQIQNLSTHATRTLLEHPATQAASSSSSEGAEPLYYRRPMFVQGGKGLLVSLVSPSAVKGYYLLDLTTEHPSYRRLALDPISDGYEQIDDDKIILTKYPDTKQGGSRVTEHSLQYFDEYIVRQFALDYDPDAPARYVQGDYIYCFQPESDPELPEDRFYRLRQINLRTITQNELPVLIQNATPDLLAVTYKGQVLFSYRSPVGSGFGITH